MSAHPPASGVAARRAPAHPQTRGFLHIDRHGAGPLAIYVVTYQRVNHGGIRAKPIEAVGAEALLELLERDRKSTRLNSSHGYISYAALCLEKKTRPAHRRAAACS